MAFDILEKHRASIESQILVSYTPSGQAYPSTRYTYDMLMDALRIMAVQGCCRDDDLKFILYDEDEFRYIYGLVNLAAFLANAMVEAIQFDSCDELNSQQVAGRYAISNSCGQHGRSYQDEIKSCGLYACQIDSTMEIVAVDTAMGVRSPPPFECREGSGPGKYSGYWDTQSGREIKDTPYSNSIGRIDVESCCWVSEEFHFQHVQGVTDLYGEVGPGRTFNAESMQYRKVGLFLRVSAFTGEIFHGLNRFNERFGIRRRAGRRALYPDVSFCLDPEATCSSQYTDEMRWTTAMFEWVDRVQLYEQGWNYKEELMQFVDDGAEEGDPFIDNVIRVFHGDCHREGCSGRPIRFENERRKNFYHIINNILQLGPLFESIGSAPSPTEVPDVFTPVEKTPGPTEFPYARPANPTEQQVFPMPPDVATLSTICKGMPRGIVTFDKCMSYVECFDGVASEAKKCSEGSIFDVSINECNWEEEVANCHENGPVQLEPFQPSEEKRPPEPTKNPTTRWTDFQTVGIGTSKPTPTTLINLEGSGGTRNEDSIIALVVLLTLAQY